ncbi:MAG: NAD-dependent epimerase/dehydratase family protein [Chloroflexi bacterium]|nr:NAD-dependent epimerase/dehydratase family protein [Chloroflexota bacterium]
MKHALLIAGGGTLGTYTAEELLRLGHSVDVICLEDKVSDNEKLQFYKANATVEYLDQLFQENRYDGIVNFIHYPNYEDYIPYHKLLSQSTEHLIFLSSYRVYADLQHPITESAPQLIDVIKDNPAFHEQETYALAKSRAERFLSNNPYPKNWTVVRPVISFSDKRLDINMVSGHTVIERAKEGKAVQLPIEARHLTAGLDWAGNSGKLIANLLFKEHCIGEAYTISSAQNITWGDVADIYTRLLNVKFEWVPVHYPPGVWSWCYDRAYDRRIDNSKVLKATGLAPKDFKSIEEGVYIELKKLGAIE